MLSTWPIGSDSLDGFSTKDEPNPTTWPDFTTFSRTLRKTPPWLKSRVLSLRHVLGSCAGRPTMICLVLGALDAPQYGR